MVQKETRAGRSAAPDMAKLMPAGLMEPGQERMAAALEVQKEIATAVHQASREWADQLKAEAELAQEFTMKLASSKSIPDAVQIYQEWLSRRMKHCFDQSQKLTTNAQKLMSLLTQALSGGTRGGGT